MIKIGMIGLDTSHVVGFTELLNDPGHEHHVPGTRVTVAWPGGSPDMALSRDRVDGFTETLHERHQVRIVDSPEAVAEACDLLFIESVDGRTHLEQFRRTVPFRRPTFIDKPFAVSLADAREMVRIAADAGIPLASASSLRYAHALQDSLARDRAGILGCDAFGPMAEEPSQPGLFWYGCHSVEMIVTAMGAGCRQVRCLRTEGHDLLTARWNDGRIASIHGIRGGHGHFGITLHRADGAEWINARGGRPPYAGLLAAMVAQLPNGQSPVPSREMLEIVAIMEAANRSRAEDGIPMDVEDGMS